VPERGEGGGGSFPLASQPRQRVCLPSGPGYFAF